MWSIIRRIVWLWVCACSLASFAGSYEQELPAGLSSDPDMCALIDCKTVLPSADTFSLRKGSPPYVEGYQNKQLKGYVFLSTDIVDTPGYSSKPIVTLMGMDTHGEITGVRVLKHSEPILLVGIPEAKLLDFLQQYVGRKADSRFEIGKVGPNGERIDAISGATVTVVAENQVIARSVYAIARQVGIVQAQNRPAAKFINIDKKATWNELVSNGSIGHFLLQPKEIGIENGNEPYLDLYFGYLNAPVIGKSILGDKEYQALMASLKPNEHALFVVANGTGSFKGSGFVRGGMYDRIQVRQDLDASTFMDTDYQNLYAIHADGAPNFGESGIFILRDKSFSAAYPWQFVFLSNKEDKQTRDKTFVAFETQYWLPAAYLVGGHENIRLPEPIWKSIWKSKWIEITIFVTWLVLVLGFFITKDVWIRKAKRTQKQWVSWPKKASWLFAIVFVGFGVMAQPSITQILMIFHSLGTGWDWHLFLSDPFIFIFWLFIVPTVLIWGRGLFCGWMCPFGALTEWLYKIVGATKLRKWQGQLPQPWHNKLKWLKYIIFAVLLGVSFYSMALAERLAEVEPFKTTFLVGVWNRSWPFVLFWSVLIAASALMERPFCKYLCPLGAGLAIPTWLRSLWPLKRKSECTTCHACAVGCGSLAIDSKGKIDQRECMLCLDCMVMYYDEHSCPPLSAERKLRAKAGLPLTKIGGDGYYIPIVPVEDTKATED